MLVVRELDSSEPENPCERRHHWTPRCVEPCLLHLVVENLKNIAPSAIEFWVVVQRLKSNNILHYLCVHVVKSVSVLTRLSIVNSSKSKSSVYVISQATVSPLLCTIEHRTLK